MGAIIYLVWAALVAVLGFTTLATLWKAGNIWKLWMSLLVVVVISPILISGVILWVVS